MSKSAITYPWKYTKIHPSLGLDYKSAKTAALKEERGQNKKR